MKAAVMRAFHKPLEIEDIDVGRPGPREVLVRTVASGVCHSDLHVVEMSLPVPPPLVLGHEPAGIVEEVGSEVTYVQPGDHVIGCLSVFCGTCEYCMKGRPNLCGGATTARAPGAPPRLSKKGEAINQFAHLSSFAEKMLVHENAVVKIRKDMPLEQAALIGCGVTTGLGAAINTAGVRPGDTCAVIACGGVGLAAIQGCRISGASKIIAIDTVAWKLDLAQKLGATDVVDASKEDAVSKVIGLTGGGVDYSFECIGTKATAAQALGMARKGGTCMLVGVLPFGQNLELNGLDIVIQEKRVQGSMMGSNRFRVDMPRYVDLYLDGRLNLDEMISARLRLEDVNTAFDKMKAGQVARSVITFS
jgi:S-(hydroxymethyl)glutathione dehydrogenase/alcohol dehydrogenase